MAKVKIKNIDGVVNNIKEVFEETKKSRFMQLKIGQFVVARNKQFARGGKSLANNKNPVKLPDLKESSKRIRRQIAKEFPGLVDGKHFKPDVSNVTLTGQLLESLTFKVENNDIVVFFKGNRKKISSDDLATNDAVYDNLVKLGFGFVGLDEKGQKRVKRIVIDELRRTIKKFFK